MKAVFVAYNQSLEGRVEFILDELVIRGFTRWTEVKGRGTVKGEPHLGTHTWPALNNTILTVLDEDKAAKLLARLRELNDSAPDPGLRAFSWQVEDMV